MPESDENVEHVAWMALSTFSDGDDEPTAISWPVSIAATLITLIVTSSIVVMCLGCLGVFGGRTS